ncbi:MAG: sulfurtransferase-like selenium metabolism protein YedF [Desulfobacteraceae bacterium]|nr:sulfurtransferase-like selenium metabolism protein YedF [Desulfobacteraceae bacterium]
MKELDCRKQACPAPVLMTRQVIEAEAPDTLTVHVDNEAACQNVSRFFASKSYEATVENAEDGFRVTGTRSGQDAQASADVTELPGSSQEPGQRPEKKIMVMITTDRMGYGDDVLGKKLMTNFVNTLNEMGPELWRLVLVNNGVRLAVTGSDVLSALQNLEKDGLAVLVCGTCLDHYGLLEHKQTGQTTNMLDIVTAMQLADQVINI